MHITMIGTGYVGLVTGTCFAEIGHDVTCVDVNEDKIKLLLDGISPIYEPGLEGMIKNNVQHKRLSFTSDLEAALAKSDCAFIAVGTPEGEDGSCDLKYVENVARQIGSMATRPLLVVTKSTVPVGTGDRVSAIIEEELKKRKLNLSISVASNPEFLKEGDAIKDFMRPDRIVIGVEAKADIELFKKIYLPFIMDDPSKLLVMDRKSSELTKYGANAMLATRISFMNELSRLCEKLGADVDAIRRGMGSDPRIGRKFLYAGPGYGGSCFPKDVMALLRTGQENGVDFSILNAVTKVNAEQKEYAAEKVSRYFGDLSQKQIAIWGLAFKPGTDDVREAPAKTIIKNLIKWGAKVVAHDPQAVASFQQEFGESKAVRYVDDAYEALAGADALLLLTEWSEYRRPNWQLIQSNLKHKAIFDLRNQYEPQEVIDMGFYYEGIGRPDSYQAQRT